MQEQRVGTDVTEHHHVVRRKFLERARELLRGKVIGQVGHLMTSRGERGDELPRALLVAAGREGVKALGVDGGCLPGLTRQQDPGHEPPSSWLVKYCSVGSTLFTSLNVFAALNKDV